MVEMIQGLPVCEYSRIAEWLQKVHGLDADDVNYYAIYSLMKKTPALKTAYTERKEELREKSDRENREIAEENKRKRKKQRRQRMDRAKENLASAFVKVSRRTVAQSLSNIDYRRALAQELEVSIRELNRALMEKNLVLNTNRRVGDEKAIEGAFRRCPRENTNRWLTMEVVREDLGFESIDALERKIRELKMEQFVNQFVKKITSSRGRAADAFALTGTILSVLGLGALLSTFTAANGAGSYALSLVFAGAFIVALVILGLWRLLKNRKLDERGKLSRAVMPLEIDTNRQKMIEAIERRGIPFKGPLELEDAPPDILNIALFNLPGSFETNAAIFKHGNSVLHDIDSKTRLLIVDKSDLEVVAGEQDESHTVIKQALLIKDGKLYLAKPGQPIKAHGIIRPYPESFCMLLEETDAVIIPSNRSLSLSRVKSLQHELLDRHGIPNTKMLAVIPYVYDDYLVDEKVAALLKSLGNNDVKKICLKPNSGSWGRNVIPMDLSERDAGLIVRLLQKEEQGILVERFVESIPVDLTAPVPHHLLEGKTLKETLRNNVRMVAVRAPDDSWSAESGHVRLGWPTIGVKGTVAYMFWEDFLEIIHFKDKGCFAQDVREKLTRKLEDLTLRTAKAVVGEGNESPMVAPAPAEISISS